MKDIVRPLVTRTIMSIIKIYNKLKKENIKVLDYETAGME